MFKKHLAIKSHMVQPKSTFRRKKKKKRNYIRGPMQTFQVMTGARVVQVVKCHVV